MSAVVDSWSCPTTVYAGVGALAHLPAAVTAAAPPSPLGAGRFSAATPGSDGGSVPPRVAVPEAIVVADVRLWPATPVAASVTSLIAPLAVATRAAADDDDDFLQQVLDVLVRHPAIPVVALGGGSILDIARLAALATVDPAFRAVLTAPAPPAPLRMWPAGRDAANPVVCLPTTLGTAAEVSPIAILRRGGGTQMFVSPALRARAALLDPVATAGHSRTGLLAGLLEPLSRALVPAVTGARLPLQDGLARALIDVLFDLGDSAGEAPDDAWRLSAALASSQTHTAFLGLGRSPFGHAIWPFATEMMVVLGLTKAEALARLLPAWLRGLASGDLGPAFGSAERVAAIMGRPPAEAAESLWLWLKDAGLGGGALKSAVPGGADRSSATLPRGHESAAVADAVAVRVRTVWQATGFFLAGAPRAEIEWLSTAALGGPPSR